MDREEAKQSCLAKWRRIRDEIGWVKVGTLLEDMTEACTFCEIAAERQARAKEEGLQKTGVRCLFCELYVRFGGCRERIDDLIAAALNEDWDNVREQVEGMIDWMSGIDLSDEQSKATSQVPHAALSK